MSGFAASRLFAPGLATLSAAWALTIGVAPTLAQSEGWGRALAVTAYGIGAVVCHQRAERSFHLAGVQLPVCARCTGLYVSAAVGVLAWISWRRLRPRSIALDSPRAVRLLVIAALPTALSVASGLAGIGDLSNAGRFTAALPLGAAVGAALAAIASNDLS